MDIPLTLHQNWTSGSFLKDLWNLKPYQSSVTLQSNAVPCTFTYAFFNITGTGQL